MASKSKHPLEKRYYVTFWGRKVLCRPVFVPTILGDGKLLLRLSCTNTRPHYYLIRIDSSWSDPNMYDPGTHENALKSEEMIDDACDAIRDYVGDANWVDDRGKHRHSPWPAFSSDSGFTWGLE